MADAATTKSSTAAAPAAQGKGAKGYSMTVGAMTVLTVAAVLSLRNLPEMASYGWSIIFVLVIACIMFFIPSALVSAELASTYTENGGVYVWVREAFGPKWGFLAIFMQWAENLPWFPAVLVFCVEGIAYAFNPALATNKWFVFALVVVLMWGSTLLNFRGMKISVLLSNSGALIGTIIAGIALIGFVLFYVFTGGTNYIPFDDGKTLIPDLGSSSTWMLIIGMLVALSGMEMTSVHVTDMKNPKKNFPKAIFLAAFIAVAISIVGSLCVAMVVPASDLSFASGVLEAFRNVLDGLHLSWLLPIACIALAYGAFTMVITWVLGPSKGLLEVAEEGYMPPRAEKRNANGMPVTILTVQAIISTLMATCILFMPTISDAFWLTSALTGQLYLIMYVLMFASAIRLRYTQPNVVRPYKVPGGKVGMWIVSGLALFASVVSIVFGFIPPSNVTGVAMTVAYEAFLVIAIGALVAVPLIFYHLSKKKDWKAQIAKQNHKALAGDAAKAETAAAPAAVTAPAKAVAAKTAPATEPVPNTAAPAQQEAKGQPAPAAPLKAVPDAAPVQSAPQVAKPDTKAGIDALKDDLITAEADFKRVEQDQKNNSTRIKKSLSALEDDLVKAEADYKKTEDDLLAK